MLSTWPSSKRATARNMAVRGDKSTQTAGAKSSLVQSHSVKPGVEGSRHFLCVFPVLFKTGVVVIELPENRKVTIDPAHELELLFGEEFARLFQQTESLVAFE